jgi:hypothetical protein
MVSSAAALTALTALALLRHDQLRPSPSSGEFWLEDEELDDEELDDEVVPKSRCVDS